MRSMAEDLLVWVGQKAFIRKDGGVLVLQSDNVRLDFPGGKIQQGETDFTASLEREVREETHLEIAIGRPFYTWHFQFPQDRPQAGKIIYLVGFMCDWVAGNVKLSSEHSGFEWVDESNYQKYTEDTQYFAALEEYFKYNNLR